MSARPMTSFKPSAKTPVILDQHGNPLSMHYTAFEGADRAGRELATWNPGSYSADGALLPELETLRDRTEDMIRNHGIASGAVQTGLPITIASGQDQGLLQWGTVQQIAALADVAGAVYVLDINGTEYSVIFRHDDAPAFSADPLIARIAPFDDDYFRCTIKLMTV